LPPKKLKRATRADKLVDTREDFDALGEDLGWGADEQIGCDGRGGTDSVQKPEFEAISDWDVSAQATNFEDYRMQCQTNRSKPARQ
jgi:hypothetical protein